MPKFLTILTFLAAAIVVTILFVTSTDYTHLAIASAFYPALAFCGLQIFPANPKRRVVQKQLPQVQPVTVTEVEPTPNTGIADIDRRAFLKIIGAAGLSIFLFSLFSRRGEGFLLGQGSPGVTSLEDTTGKKINPAEKQPLDGYQITEIDDTNGVSYYGFTKHDGSWAIMKEDNETTSFRYAIGEKDFPSNWENRKVLSYDYYFKVFSE